ncbi:MAG: DUF924 domain-containing protein [Porticoccaceae bacterium]|nr:DUF924 domain-containing protein [Porticoccaceae bacterium]
MEIEQVLEFWFGSDLHDPELAKRQSPLWWQKNPHTDALIREKFTDGLQGLVSGDYKHWLETPRGRLAAIIVLDQFSRNMYRDRARAFAQDSLALNWCLEGMSLKQDLELPYIGRVFFYLPLEHSESLEMQDLSVQKFTELAQLAGAKKGDTFSGFKDFAQRHREVIQQFGRYPHRNSIVGRESTAAEQLYLDQPGSGF